jgi:uncharacterized protein YuzE
MREPYLEVTYRHGRPLAAYLYLPQRPGQKSYRTKELAPGLLVDYARNGAAIGIEITAPKKTTLIRLNRVLTEIGQEKLKRADLAPLRAA